MATESSQSIKTYLHLCFECGNDFDTEQKMDNCPDCNKPFKEVWEHFVYPSRSAYLYRHECKKCKIIIDDGRQEDRLCPQCKKPLEGGILSIAYIMSNTFWGRLSRKIRKYLP